MLALSGSYYSTHFVAAMKAEGEKLMATVAEECADSAAAEAREICQW